MKSNLILPHVNHLNADWVCWTIPSFLNLKAGILWRINLSLSLSLSLSLPEK